MLYMEKKYDQELLRQIAYRIDNFLIENKLTHVQFSKKINVSKQVVGNMLNKYQGITTARLQKISKEYQLNLNWLINGTGRQKFNNSEDIEIINVANSLDQFFKSPNYSLELLLDNFTNQLVAKVRNQQNKKHENSRAYFLLIHILSEIGLNENETEFSKMIILDAIRRHRYKFDEAKKELTIIINNLTDFEYDFILKYKEKCINNLKNSFGIVEEQFFKLDLKRLKR